MRIAFFEIFNEVLCGEKKVLQKFFPDDEVSYFDGKLDSDNISLIQDVEVISIFTTSLINKEVVDRLPHLKFINTSATGYDHIDTEYCKTKNIRVSNVPAYGSDTVAEFTFALLLSLSRKIAEANSGLRREGGFDIKTLCGFDLKGKTLGVIGTGRIGKNVIRIARGFNMNVIACDAFPNKELATELGFSCKSFSEIISQSDIITLHVPYSQENHHLINRANVSQMKRGVYLLNTARGGLVDTDALIWGLREGIIAGAGLDVLEDERELKEELIILSDISGARKIADYRTLLEDHVLIDMPNVIVTPHIAFYSKEALENIIRTTVENIKGFMAGRPVNLV